jgi:hypothetical protein
MTFSILFCVLSLFWLGFYGWNFYVFNRTNQELSRIAEIKKEVDNLPFYDRYIKNLMLEYENIQKQSFSGKSTSEFIAKLPKIAEFSGITGLVIENAGVKSENDLEVTELHITCHSQFPDVANFIDVLERSKMPIHVQSLVMKNGEGNLTTAMVLKVYKKTVGD